MRINAVRLVMETDNGQFGFEHSFGPRLTIIRGRNSSGKSTIVNSLLYCLGMEELIGGRGEATLPYAVKDWFEHDGQKVAVNSSEVFVELLGAGGKAITIRRAIKHPSRKSKLVEVAEGRRISEHRAFDPERSMFLFDAGAAQLSDGFHRYLEEFLGLKLPQVPAISGGHTKLYLQTIFAALAVEQKRGWTDYVANIPYFGIREARTRVVEYLLGLDVFEHAARRSELDSEAVTIDYRWQSNLQQIRQISTAVGLTVRELPSGPKADFGAAAPIVRKVSDRGEIDVASYVEALRDEYRSVEARVSSGDSQTSGQSQVALDYLLAEMQRYSNLYETASASLTLHRASLHDMEALYESAKEDLHKNKTAAKLRDLGSQKELMLSTGKCPTCHQDIVDSLVDSAIAGPQMDLAANISFLERQCSMFERQIAGLAEALREDEATKVDLGRRTSNLREQLDSARKDLTAGTQQSRVDLRRQLQIESEVKGLEDAQTSLAGLFVELQKLSSQLAENQRARRSLPNVGYSSDDERRIASFEKNFRANAGAFEYESASVEDIEINRSGLLPSLRQVQRAKTDIKADSSASDFVRLIWSYLLALYQTSSNPSTSGNHPSFLMLDEPGQHSMAANSQHALMQLTAAETGLQCVVAASFDESEGVFKEATAGVDFVLIQIDGKAIRPLALSERREN